MRKTTGTMMAVALAQAGAASAQFGPSQPPPPAPRTMPGDAMQPSSKWLANFADNSCEMVRDFGAGKQQMELLVRPLTGSTTVQFEIHYHGAAPHQLGGSARLAMYPGTASAVGSYYDAALPPTEPFERMMRFTMQRSQIADLGGAQVITFVYATRPISLAPGALGNVAKVLKECEDDLIKTWGYDPQVMNSLKTGPVPVAPEKWYRAKDLPTKNDAKDVMIPSVRFTVGTDGAVSNCAVVTTSGSKMFDDKACEVMTTKAHYKPAMGANGQPVAALMVSPVMRPFGP